MASNKEYLDFIMDQFSDLEDVKYRAMYDKLPAPKK